MSSPSRLLLAAMTALLATSAAGQELEISVSPTPVGSGARAAGMADAFVAIADDATAASWNPAGLVQLERPEISIVGSYNGIREEFSARWHDEVDSSHSDGNYDLNYLSLAWPLPVLVLGRNATVSLNYQRKYDFSRQFDLDYNTAAVFGPGLVLNNLLGFEFEQEGGLGTISPAFALELTHRLSLGVTLNLWRSSFLGDNSWKQEIRAESFSLVGSWPSYGLSMSKAEYKDFHGENATLGLLWSVNDKWSFGARYDTAFTGKADYKRVGLSLDAALSTGGIGLRPLSAYDPRFVQSEQREVRFPASLALGVAYRPNDRLTVSFDVTRTDWEDFHFKDASGRKFSLVNGAALHNVLGLNEPRFDPTVTARLGAEYVFVPKQPGEEALGHLWTLRGGLFYDPEPASKRPGRYDLIRKGGSGEPEDFYGAAVGAGLLLGRRVNIDAAYQYRFGNGVNQDFIRGIAGFEEDVRQHRVLLSTVIYF